MGFDWIYLNPWHYPGFSGSLYAPKEFDRLNPLFLPPGEPERSLRPLAQFLREAAELGARVMMDLVVNHTSKDCPLAEKHPTWYRRTGDGELVSPSVVDPGDPGRVTVWGDLAEIDNAGTPDREGLWGFWAGLVRESLQLGFSGFRCDAAYMVPAELWRYLIEGARALRPDVLFFAETLGAPEEDVLALHDAGFDYFFNSSKWWNYTDDWALEQHARFGAIAPSISFPETHDTTRLAADTGGNEALQRQRYAFAAVFSAGVMMPIGYEYGFEKKLDVVRTMPSDWERQRFDLTDFIARVNELKQWLPVLHGEGHLQPVLPLDLPVLLLRRDAGSGKGEAWVVLNKDAYGTQEVDLAPILPELRSLSLLRVCRDGSEPGAVPDRLRLDPGEITLIVPTDDLRRVSAGVGPG